MKKRCRHDGPPISASGYRIDLFYHTRPGREYSADVQERRDIRDMRDDLNHNQWIAAEVASGHMTIRQSLSELNRLRKGRP